ncbi:hypothetical protein C0993_010010 [Termitomyces sp. T159_Od127]|nr:hypothetical protein C0993_010010 [Termitomyces sp. T159_Od127]
MSLRRAFLALAGCFLGALVVHGSVLVNFQVSQPPIVPRNSKQCIVKVLQCADLSVLCAHIDYMAGEILRLPMEGKRHQRLPVFPQVLTSHTSAEVVQLTPPTDCGPVGSWAAITLNLTVTSNGTQYDRLAHFTFHNVEIWRTSTPEPTRGDGIIWTYIKDVSQYMPLFASEGTFILQLDNVIQTGLDGIYSTVVHATYYASSEEIPPANKADLIVPISTLANNTGNEASVPPSFSRNISLPTNTVKVFAEIFASGNGQEEFWYMNAANDFLPNLPNGTTYGQGPFREVRLLIDGLIAGVALPYPVIFTGGLAPSLWRPIAAYGALDLPSYFLDITPFVPILIDGKPHEFSIDVVSAEDDHTILQNWYVSGLLQVITDSSSKPTTGNITAYNAPTYAETNVTGSVGPGTVNITVKGSHNLYVEAEILSGSGELTHVVWSQELVYSNAQSYSDDANIQVSSTSSIHFLTTYKVSKGFTSNGFWANCLHAQRSACSDGYIFISCKYRFCIQESAMDELYVFIAAGMILMPGGNYGNGTSGNTFNYTDAAGNTYTRRVNASLNVITLDEEGGSLANTSNFVFVTCVQSAVLVDFQVAEPPPVPKDAKQCTVQVLQRDFAFSFGRPPTDCGSPGSWAAVTLNFTVTSNGTQFDRLGIFTFQNVEIWRTSTPEPTRGDGIIWTYVKDVTRYIPLFAKPGTFILQLDNLIQPGLDGIYSVLAIFDHSYDRDLLPFPAVPRSNITERQEAVAFFKIASTGNTGNGTNSNVFAYSDSAGNTYQREVKAVLNNITFDEQSGSLAPIADHGVSKDPGPSATKFARARLPGGRVVGT